MSAIPHHELAGARKMFDLIVGALDEEPPPEDAAGVELLALAVQAPFTAPDDQPELVRELPAALARRGDPLAADVLVAIERLAPEPLSALAAEQRARLEARGIAGVHMRDIGRLAVAGAEVHRIPEGEIWLVILEREGSDGQQPLLLFVDREPCGGVIVGGSAGPPGKAAAIEERLRQLGTRLVERLDDRELLARLRSALAHMDDHDVPLEADAAEILPLLERALTGEVGRLPRPLLAFEPDDEDALRDHAEALVEAFAESLESRGAAIGLHAPFVAHCMLDWKLDYADGRLGRWTLSDLRELMVDWLPRKITMEDETIELVGDAIAAFLRFLAAEELLDAPVPLASLEAAVERLRPRCQQALRDPRRWGVAKGMAAQMAAEGVDLAEREAVEAWIADFNSRSRDEREAILGPLPAARPRPGAPGAQRRAKRKAARRARRRNRR